MERLDRFLSAMGLASRKDAALLARRGEIWVDGAPCRDPAKKFPEGTEAEIRGVRFELSEFQQKALKQNGQKACDIVAGIRPQHITVGHGELSALIEVSEMLGTEVNLHTRSNDDEVVMVIPTVDLDTDVSMGRAATTTRSSW